MNYRSVIVFASVLLASASLVQAETSATATTTAPAATTTDTTATTTTTTAPAATATDTAAPAVTATPIIAVATLTSVSMADFVNVVDGWSAKKGILDKKIVNEKGDKVGEVQDLIIAPDSFVSYAIVDVGGFLGMGEHRVAIPVKFFNMQADHIVLDGATKDLLKQIPEFKYTKG